MIRFLKKIIRWKAMSPSPSVATVFSLSHAPSHCLRTAWLERVVFSLVKQILNGVRRGKDSLNTVEWRSTYPRFHRLTEKNYGEP